MCAERLGRLSRDHRGFILCWKIIFLNFRFMKKYLNFAKLNLFLKTLKPTSTTTSQMLSQKKTDKTQKRNKEATFLSQPKHSAFPFAKKRRQHVPSNRSRILNFFFFPHYTVPWSEQHKSKKCFHISFKSNQLQTRFDHRCSVFAFLPCICHEQEY